MPYTIFNANGTSTVIPDNVINSTFYDATNKVGVQMPGRNSIDFGQPIAQNFLQLLENFSGTNTPGGNDATAPIGMIWHDTTTGLLKFQSAAATWTPLLTGNQSITVSGDISGSGTTSLVLTLPAIATAGIYKSVTVNAKGQVTAGTNPTTLAGYGITDALSSTNPTATGTFTLSHTSPVFITRDTDSTVTTMLNYTSYKDSTNIEVGWVGYGNADGSLGIYNFGRNINLLSPVVLSSSITGSGAGLTSLNATNLSSGTVSATLLANSGASAGTYGSSSLVPVVTVDAKGRITSITTSAISGGSTTLSGDVTGTGSGTIATTLAASGVVPGTYLTATTINQVTVDAKGRTIGVGAPQTITPAFSSITSKPTTVSGYGITDAVTSVGVSGANGIGVSGSPITSSGTISLSLGAITPSSVAATGTVTGSNLSGSSSGTNTGDQTITLTGDVTGTGTGSFATTLANSGVSAGSYGSSTSVPVVTFDAKGRATSATTVAIGTAGRLLNIQKFTTPGLVATYTPTAGTNSIIVEAVGGGGGSGGGLTASAGQITISSAGGQGAYGKGQYFSGFSGLTVTVGTGGAGGVNGIGSNGTSSSLGSLISCAGGTGSPTSYIGSSSVVAASPVASIPPAAPVTGSGIIIQSINLSPGQQSWIQPNGGSGSFQADYQPTVLGGFGAGARGNLVIGSTAGSTGLAGFGGAVIIYEYS